MQKEKKMKRQTLYKGGDDDIRRVGGETSCHHDELRFRGLNFPGRVGTKGRCVGDLGDR